MATPRLVRATGDDEIREWAREAIQSLEVPAPPSALASVKRMADGPVPEDPAADVLWTAAMVVLAEDAIDLATAASAGQGGDADADDGIADLGDLLGDDET